MMILISAYLFSPLRKTQETRNRKFEHCTEAPLQILAYLFHRTLIFSTMRDISDC